MVGAHLELGPTSITHTLEEYHPPLGSFMHC